MEDYTEEQARCANDFSYFCEKYVKIKHPTKGIIDFHPYSCQTRLFKHIEENRFSIAKKFRQGGFSTLTNTYLLWKCLFNDNFRALNLCPSDRWALEDSYITKVMIDHLPDWLSSTIEYRKEHMLKFKNDSTMQFHGTRSPIHCGSSHNFVVFSEITFWENADRWWKTIYPTISDTGNALVISAPYNRGEWFRQTYQDAELQKNNFTVFRTSYFEVPEFDNVKWVNEVQSAMGELGWRIEVLGEFI